MVIIFTHELDYSTYRVTEWLNFFNTNYIQLNESKIFLIQKLEITNGKINFVFTIDNIEYNWNDISKVWYRRGGLSIYNFNFNSGINIEFDKSLNSQVSEEKAEITAFILKLFRSKSLNNELDNNINKIELLEECKKFKIKIPQTIITSSKMELEKFREKNGRIITKNCTPGLNIEYKNYYLTGFTTELTQELLNDLDDTFFPTFCQKLIEKSFEVRSFYLDGQFYSSAILSQEDNQTKLDFRNYNLDCPNRTPPFQLPYDLEEKLTKLMKSFNLNCGSIDLIVDQNGEYYFLEVNPVGQYSQVSHPCNYYLEEKIAKYLSIC